MPFASPGMFSSPPAPPCQARLCSGDPGWAGDVIPAPFLCCQSSGKGAALEEMLGEENVLKVSQTSGELPGRRNYSSALTDGLCKRMARAKPGVVGSEGKPFTHCC